MDMELFYKLTSEENTVFFVESSVKYCRWKNNFHSHPQLCLESCTLIQRQNMSGGAGKESSQDHTKCL